MAAQKYGLKSIAFLLISAGIFGYPNEAALEFARATIHGFRETADLDVYLVLFDA